jgi:hypothetical protein
MATARIPYNPALFRLRRWTSTSSSLDEFLVGVSLLGSTGSGATDIEAATVTLTSGYTPDTVGQPEATPPIPPGTLLVEAETATIGLSFWDQPGELLYPADRIAAYYAGELIFRGTITSTSLSYVTDPAATAHGATRRVDFSATAAGLYAVQMNRTVTWTRLPLETAIQRIRRWVTVTGW